jgi:hypothetical protein
MNWKGCGKKAVTYFKALSGRTEESHEDFQYE